MSKKPAAGEIAPDFSFNTPWLNTLNFFDHTNGSAVILIFLRYIGCPVCRMEMANIRRTISLAKKKQAQVFVILQSTPEIIASLCSADDWPFTIVCDNSAKIFDLYKVSEGSIFSYLHPAGIISAAKSMLNGNMHGKFEGRETQLPAAFVISSDRRIKFAYYGKRIDDVPSLETLAAYL